MTSLTRASTFLGVGARGLQRPDLYTGLSCPLFHPTWLTCAIASVLYGFDFYLPSDPEVHGAGTGVYT